jgi:uncharacterized iron-regulated membrane protein
MQSRTIRRWSWIHKWTSLICTVFILLLCMTGLPLLFMEEINGFLNPSVEAAAVDQATSAASLDAIVSAGLALRPGSSVQFMLWDRDDPNTVRLAVGITPTSPAAKNIVLRFDAHTAACLDAPVIPTGRPISS